MYEYIIYFEGLAGKGPHKLWATNGAKKIAKNPGSTILPSWPSAKAISTPALARSGPDFTF
jgi:hypothetical protein